MTNKIIRVTTVPGSLNKLLKGQLRFMSKHFEVIAISSRKDSVTSTSGISNVAINEDVEVYSVEMTRKITPIQDLKAVYQLYRIFRKEKPDIVHSHTPKAGTVAMIAAKLAGVPQRLHTIAGLPLLVTTGFKRTLLDTVEKVTYGCATKIYPNSFGLKDIIIAAQFTKPSKLKVIGRGSSNGIDTTYFSPNSISNDDRKSLKKQLDISEDDFVFIYLGRITGDKGIKELVEAFKNIKQNQPSKLLIVGTFEPDLDPIPSSTQKEIELNSNILLVGWQKDVRPYLSIAHVLTFPSYREGFPNVVMQAGAMGIFSIVSNINGCNEIIKESKNGYIIPVKDSHSLQNAMEKVLDNKLEIINNTDIYRKIIVDSYEQQFIWEELLNEYHLLLRTI
ncbi:glycosyltransferase family 4 protein [Aquimarina sp. ERC-38]|uniref:glycosyltransferase family 4 protein n=1 Tax=Aquimarina sp. ERC-38 TaxID=2949996 RepID=UPI0022459827|nr:glycosyltransferase family 4 protein [Aquimarina sp. ERC-38]UZO80236.1 glycosyltransferase family 4 protein [Aquimarina sp. ERC-38]